MTAVRRRGRNHLASFGLALALFSLSSSLSAGTIVRFSTTMGDFSIELFDQEAPITVQNFLNYVERNAYNGTFLHRVVDNFVAQGGAYRWQPFSDLIVVEQDPPIANEFGISNTVGTIAMAKLDGDENSATNQWFVNLTDNTSLDTTNGGFAVFGQVLGSGMDVLRAIDDLGAILLGALVPNAPHVSEVYESPKEFVYLNVEVTQRYSEAPHLFESVSGLLITTVDINNGEDLVSMNFNAVPSESSVVIQLNSESVIPRANSFDGIATFSTADNRLRIPELEVNLNGSVSAVSNVVFVVSNAELGQLTLESFQQN